MTDSPKQSKADTEVSQDLVEAAEAMEKVREESAAKEAAKNVYMSVCFHSISLQQAENIKQTLLEIAPAGVSYAVYFDDAVVVDHI